MSARRTVVGVFVGHAKHTSADPGLDLRLSRHGGQGVSGEEEGDEQTARDAMSTTVKRSAHWMSENGAVLTSGETEALLCFAAYKQLASVWPEEPGRFKDFVTRPKANGYQSLHTNLRLPDGRTFELQIRTAAMHEVASSGSAAHNAYRAAQLGAADSPRLLPPSSTTSKPAAGSRAPLAKLLPEAVAS